MLKIFSLTPSSASLLSTGLLALVISVPTLATEKKPLEFNPAASIQLGSDAYELKLGLGNWTDNNTSYTQLYISHFKAEDTLEVGKFSIKNQEYTSSRIGIDVDSFGTERSKAFQGGIFLYKNESQANIDRSGLGVAFALGHMLTSKARIQAGVELMPEFLSTDWDAKAFLEYELKVGATYRITPKVDAGVNYRYGAINDSLDIQHYQQLLVGLSLKL